MSQTNETTRLILNHLFKERIFAWRNSVGAGSGTYTDKQGNTKTRWFQMGKSGSPDIMGILDKGLFFGCEIKTGKDKISELQESFHLQAKQRGAIIFVVKDFDDFLLQWQDLKKE